MTPNDPINALAGQRFARVFGAAGVYQTVPKSSKDGKDGLGNQFHGRMLFSEQATYFELDERIGRGEVLKSTKLSETFSFDDFKKRYGADALPLFFVTEEEKLRIITADKPFEPKPGLRLVALVKPEPAEKTA